MLPLSFQGARAETAAHDLLECARTTLGHRRELIEAGHRLCQQHGVTSGKHHHAGTDLEPFGAGNGEGQGPLLVGANLGEVAMAVMMGQVSDLDPFIKAFLRSRKS